MTDAAAEQLRMSGSLLVRWLQSGCETGEFAGAELGAPLRLDRIHSTPALHKAFHNFCRSIGARPPGDVAFGKQLKAIFGARVAVPGSRAGEKGYAVPAEDELRRLKLLGIKPRNPATP
jgi:hypothetical protein